MKQTKRSLLVDAVVIMHKLTLNPFVPKEDREMAERWIAIVTRLLYPSQAK